MLIKCMNGKIKKIVPYNKKQFVKNKMNDPLWQVPIN